MTTEKPIAIVVGASGLVGTALMDEFHPHYRVVGTYCTRPAAGLIHLDLRDPAEVRSVLYDLRPEVVLCSAAQPNVELCEVEPEATRQINVIGLQNLLTVTAGISAGLVYFSSEYVFDGLQGPYTEQDSCNPLNEYGIQKLECERMIAAQMDRFIIGRVSGVYDWEKNGKNFVARFIDTLRSSRTIEVPFDQVITPTFAPSLARAVRHLVEHSNWDLFHLSGPLPMPRIEFAHLIAETFGLDQSLIVPTPTSGLKLRATRPRSAGLKTDKAQSLLDFPVLGPGEGLKMMRSSREQKIQVDGSTSAPQKSEESTVL